MTTSSRKPPLPHDILRFVQELDGSEVSTLRRINERAVLRFLFDKPGEHSVAEIAAACALSRPTVEGALAQLVQDGWILETAAQPLGQRAGRPAKRYSLADRANVLVGLDLGPHGFVCVVTTLRGEPLASVRSSEIDLTDGETAFDAVQQAMASALADADAQEQDVVALTVGLPAIVGADGGIALTVVVPQWQTFDLPARIRGRYGSMRVIFENDAKLATVGEHAWGSAAGTQSAVNVLVGHRVAAGMIIDGRLARGVHGGAGEIGALPSTRWASAHRRLADATGSMDQTLDAIAHDDPQALRQLQKFADDLARGIAALCLALDPEVVVIGGGVAQLGERLLAPLRAAVAALTLFPIELRISQLGQSAVALGGIALCREYVTATVMQIG
ncbi:ROK family protein [Microbacterium sp. 2MCAF23]|uniref:ROK family transcriptional regulator n=1 Tax=Microbacterium sp. 2MCAF23 TaxID=3232985 RepID=UPI003F9C5CD8